MSTRGCVAIGTPEHWQGVYNHWDSYPTYLGAKLWEHLHPNGQLRDLNAFAEDLLMYGDWREYLNRGVCPYCGQKGVGQPHTISGPFYDYWLRSEPLPEPFQSNLEKHGYPDPEAKYHEHGNGPDDQISSEYPDPLYIEWVYVINPANKVMTVLTACRAPKPANAPVFESIRPLRVETPQGSVWWYPDIKAAYRHVVVASIDLTSPEPDWRNIEVEGNRVRNETYDKYAFPPVHCRCKRIYFPEEGDTLRCPECGATLHMIKLNGRPLVLRTIEGKHRGWFVCTPEGEVQRYIPGALKDAIIELRREDERGH